MKMMIFDFRESERKFFENNKFSDFEFEFIKEPLNEITKLSEEQLNETVIISVFISSNVTENVIKKFKNLRIITTRSESYSHIDINYCKNNNLAVFNVNNYGKFAAAQYAFLLILALLRQLVPAYIDLQRGMIKHENYEGRSLENITLGLIGCGAIGREVAKIGNFFGMKVYICSFEKDEEISPFAQYVTPDKLLEESDVISIHLDYTSECKNFINADTLSKMKDGVILVNISDSGIIDTVALYNALIEGKVKSAALDITECEKLTATLNGKDLKDRDSECASRAFVLHKLLSLNNVIITPRIAYNTEESVYKTLEENFNSIRDYLKGLHTNQIR